MTTVTRPRGPLPPRVYWTRRLLVLAVVLALVFVLSRVFGGDDPVKSPVPSAQPVGSAVSPSATDQVQPTRHKRAKHAKARQRPLAVPTGRCDDSDVLVKPAVEGAYAGSDVTITLILKTRTSPACNWLVTPDSVVVKLTSGSDRIWSSQDCPRTIRREPVVLRKHHRTEVQVVWNGQRSDATCSRTTLWAQPGFYHAEAAALGSDPTDVQFELRQPVPATITPSPTPDPDRKGNGRTDASDTAVD